MWVALELCIKCAMVPIEMISSKNGLSEAFFWVPHGGLDTTRSASWISISFSPILELIILTQSLIPRYWAFLVETSQDSWSESTSIADPAPNRTAPIPRIPFPHPKSTTLQPGFRSLNDWISKSHLAAISPSVWYCSRFKSGSDIPSNFESLIANERRRMFRHNAEVFELIQTLVRMHSSNTLDYLLSLWKQWDWLMWHWEC